MPNLFDVKWLSPEERKAQTLQLLRKEDINTLYHFTDGANLDSITAHGGLFSWYQCRRRGIVIPRPGGNSRSRYLDKKWNNTDYVRLCWTRKHPMLLAACRKPNPRIITPHIIEFDLGVLSIPGTLYCDTNAASGRKPYDFLIAYDIPRLRRPAIQAEVLIPKYIPSSYFSAIYPYEIF